MRIAYRLADSYFKQSVQFFDAAKYQDAFRSVNIANEKFNQYSEIRERYSSEFRCMDDFECDDEELNEDI
jgi:hypothetical protein